MGMMFLLLMILTNVITAVWVGHVAENNGVKYWNAFWVTALLGPICGLLYTIVKSMNPACSCK